MHEESQLTRDEGEKEKIPIAQKSYRVGTLTAPHVGIPRRRATLVGIWPRGTMLRVLGRSGWRPAVTQSFWGSLSRLGGWPGVASLGRILGDRTQRLCCPPQGRRSQSGLSGGSDFSGISEGRIAEGWKQSTEKPPLRLSAGITAANPRESPTSGPPQTSNLICFCSILLRLDLSYASRYPPSCRTLATSHLHTYTYTLSTRVTFRVCPSSFARILPLLRLDNCFSAQPLRKRSGVLPSKRLASRNNTVRACQARFFSPLPKCSLRLGRPITHTPSGALGSVRPHLGQPHPFKGRSRTHPLTRSLTYLLTPRAVYFLMVTSAHVAPSASETRLLLHHRRTATEAS